MCFWQELHLITYSQTAVLAWCMMGDVVWTAFPSHASPHGVSVLCIYKEDFWTWCLCVLLKLKCPPGCKKWFENAVVAVMLFFCLYFTEKQRNRQVKNTVKERKKINKPTASKQNIRIQTVFFKWNKRDFIWMVNVMFSTRLSWLVKLVHPLQMGQIDWEMTEEGE